MRSCANRIRGDVERLGEIWKTQAGGVPRFIFTDADLSEAVHNGPDAECRSSHGDRQGKEAGLAAAAFGSDFGLALGELGCFFSGDLSCRHV